MSANAGIACIASLGDVSEEMFDSVFAINVKGLFFSVQEAPPLMSDGSSIILNSSVVASKGWAANSVYSATKVGAIVGKNLDHGLERGEGFASTP